MTEHSASIGQAKQEVKKLTEKLQARELEAQPGMTMLETFESNVNQVLNKARDDAGTSAQNSLLATNNVVRMVTAGSKGSFINISQVRHWPHKLDPQIQRTALCPRQRSAGTGGYAQSSLSFVKDISAEWIRLSLSWAPL